MAPAVEPLGKRRHRRHPVRRVAVDPTATTRWPAPARQPTGEQQTLCIKRPACRWVHVCLHTFDQAAV